MDGYRSGAAVKELASRFGIHRTTVTQHLYRSGVDLRRRRLDDEQVNQAVHLYRRGSPSRESGPTLESMPTPSARPCTHAASSRETSMDAADSGPPDQGL